jgi:uncharacterized protein (DUF2235 family)
MVSKNIIICSDGTGNTAIKGRGTNVFKLYEAVDLHGHHADPTLPKQIAFYDDGVGTEDLKPIRIFAGVTGWGLSRNVKQLYKELVRVYEPEDRVFLFGFSRGAFTVRTLAGFMATCGILDVSKLKTTDELNLAVKRAYKAYRRKYRTKLAELFLGKPDTAKINAEINEFRKKHCLNFDVGIEFIGVWDTVDAVGLPFHLSDVLNRVVYRFKFTDQELSSKVKKACHALAVDDERHSFHPVLWNETGESGDRIEQVWFAGVHSNVGGGYPKQGVSLVALDWMMERAERAGLHLVACDRSLYHEHMNVDDKLYDPRAGLGVFYRWKPRDIVEMCRKSEIERPAIHLSVVERIEHGTEDYAPGNLPANARIVTTLTGNKMVDDRTWQAAQLAETVLHQAHGNGPSLPARVRRPIAIGRLSYYVYLITCTAILIAAAMPAGALALSDPLGWGRNLVTLVWRLVTSPIDMAVSTVVGFFQRPWLLGSLAGGLLLSYLLAFFADRRISAIFSEFWHGVRPKLRKSPSTPSSNVT